MAECTLARCVQERRAIKRELQRWARNVPLAAGLERIAEEYMGLERWAKYQDTMYHGLLTDNGESEDFDPDEKCHFCDGRRVGEPLFFPSESSQSSIETPPMPPVPAHQSESGSSLVEGYLLSSAAATAASSSSSCSLGAAASPLAAAAAAVAAAAAGGIHAPFFFPPPLLPFYLSSSSSSHLDRDSPSQESPPCSRPDSLPSDEPLDLSAKSRDPDSKSNNKTRLADAPNTMPSLKVPNVENKSIFRAKPRMSASGTRKTYTEEELQAALRDIQSGKLGTRRAAVIYGIPRSTLRNKVYKLHMEKVRDNHLLRRPAPSSGSSTTAAKSAATTDKKENNEEEEDNSSTSASSDLRATPDLSSSTPNCRPASESLKQFIQSRKQNQETDTSAYVSHMLSNIQELALGTGTRKSAEEWAKDLKLPPLLPELIKRFAGERLEEHRQQIVNGCHEDEEEEEEESNDEDAATASPSAGSNVILRIPSFRPTSKNGVANGGQVAGVATTLPPPPPPSVVKLSSQNVISGGTPPPVATSAAASPSQLSSASSDGGTNPSANISLKEIIARSISQKFHNDDTVKPSEKPKPSGKGTRPKRGKYRNYNRDNLMQAVRAVQRGEMSVHRAGSHFGVPHSTLEYKVKERHLLRPRKREAKQKAAAAKRNGKSRPKTPPLQNGVKAPPPLFDPTLAHLCHYPFSYPFWPPPSAPNFDLAAVAAATGFDPGHFIASQMMRKLQEDASSSDKPAASGSPSDDKSVSGDKEEPGFLDGLIRVALDGKVGSGGARREAEGSYHSACSPAESSEEDEGEEEEEEEGGGSKEGE